MRRHVTFFFLIWKENTYLFGFGLNERISYMQLELQEVLTMSQNQKEGHLSSSVSQHFSCSVN